MNKGKRKKDKARSRHRDKPASAGSVGVWHRRRWLLTSLLAGLLIFYWTPLTSTDASIQWDAVDVHYSAQSYFSESILDGRLPLWTPYIYSGFPFLADPQTGAWYPFHWPFFLLGVTPKSLQWELLLHCLIALVGTFLLAREYFPRPEVAALAALAYAFSGYFAGHSSHIGSFGAAAWLPWLLFTLRRAMVTGRAEWMAFAGIVVGLDALLGHFQTTLYCLFAAGFFCVAHAIEDRRRLVRAVAAPAVATVIGLLLAAILVIPGLGLASESIRSGMTFTDETNAPLVPSALATLLHPNALGAIEGPYRGPDDITQFYFYAGVLLLPLAAVGIRRSPVLMAALALTIPALWYAFGPAAGLYRTPAWLPGFANVRAPVHIWFVVALGLALLAASGFSTLLRRWNSPYLALGIPLLFFVDLCYWNSARNPLAYARADFEEAYGRGQRLFEGRIGKKLPPLTRFHVPYPSATFGSLNHPLDSRAETTYGYNPLELARYRAYMDAARQNPKLLDGLNVSRVLRVKEGAVVASEGVLPRAYFPKNVIRAADDEEARKQLLTLDPAESAIIVSIPAPAQDPGASVEITDHRADGYRMRYRCASDSLLRIAVPYYPGWQATLDGQDLPVVPVDHALMGVVVPAGEHELEIDFRLPRFTMSAGISLATAVALAVLLILRRRRTPGSAPVDYS